VVEASCSVSIKTKLIGLLGLAVISILLIGGSFIIGQRSSSAALQEHIALENVRRQLSRIELSIAQMDSAAQRFLIERTSTMAGEFKTIAAEPQSNLRGLAGSAPASGLENVLDDLRSGLSDYVSAMSNIIEAQKRLGFIDQLSAEVANDGLQEPEGLMVDMSDAKGALDKILMEEMDFNESISLHKLGALLSTLSERETKLIAYGTPEHLSLLSAAVANVQDILKGEEIYEEFKATFEAPLTKYRDAVSRWSATQTEQIASSQDIEKYLKHIHSTIKTSNTTIDAFLLHASQQSDHAKNVAKSTFILAVIISLYLLATLSFLFGRLLLSGMKNLTDRMTQLASGDTDFTVSDCDREDELGTMWRSVAVFRDNAIEQSQLIQKIEAEQKSREKRQVTMEALISSFREEAKDLLEEVSANAAQMQATARTLATGATETSGDLQKPSRIGR